MKTLVKIIVFLILSTVSVTSQEENKFTITVVVKNLDSNNGKVYFALYDSENNFLNTPLKGLTQKVNNYQSKLTFKNIPVGTYAVSIFHDENDNNKLDTNFIGIPKEAYGCSNNAKGFMGPPKWTDAKFNLNKDKKITINI